MCDTSTSAASSPSSSRSSSVSATESSSAEEKEEGKTGKEREKEDAADRAHPGGDHRRRAGGKLHGHLRDRRQQAAPGEVSLLLSIDFNYLNNFY